LVRREQGEAAATGHHAGYVARVVVVGLNLDRVPDPDPRHDDWIEQLEVVVVRERRQALRQRRGLNVDCRRLGIVEVCEQRLQADRKRRHAPLEIGAAQVIPIEESTFDRRIGSEERSWTALLEAQEVSYERLGGVQPMRHGGPTLHHTAQERRLMSGEDPSPKCLWIDVAPLGHAHGRAGCSRLHL